VPAGAEGGTVIVTVPADAVPQRVVGEETAALSGAGSAATPEGQRDRERPAGLADDEAARGDRRRRREVAERPDAGDVEQDVRPPVGVR
jgi:hypothetical protein